MNSKIIAVDFDGTLCENKWPEIGEANEDMIYYLRKRQAEGDKLILWTCRVGDMLRKAINWCYNYGLIFSTVNDKLGYFHAWEHYSKPLEASPLIGGAPAGVFSKIFGIVEFSDGVRRVDPTDICFCDEENQMLSEMEKFENE